MTLYSRNIKERRGRILKNEMGIINFNSLDVATIFLYSVTEEIEIYKTFFMKSVSSSGNRFFCNLKFMGLF